MLVRSTRNPRHRTSHILAASFAQLNLPWLAPAQARWTVHHASTVSSTSSLPPRQSTSRNLRSNARVRRLATTAEQISPIYDIQFPPPGYSTRIKNSDQDHYIPWGRSLAAASLIDPRSHDPIVINNSTAIPQKPIRLYAGVSAHTEELLVHLHTSLRVGRRERAEVIIQRLAETCEPVSPELVHAHNIYLENLLGKLISHDRTSAQSEAIQADMQKWFEVELRRKGVRPSAKTLVTMIRAAIWACDGSSCERAIRRYVNISEDLGPEAFDEVLFSDDYDDHEFTILGEATAELYEEDETSPQPVSLELEPQSQTSQTGLRREEVVDMTRIPEVLATEQKGGGLSGIKRTLEAFTESEPLPPNATVEEQTERALARQQRLEETSAEVAIESWRKADEELRKIGISTTMSSKPIGALTWQWYQTFLAALEQELEEVEKTLSSPGGKETDRHYYGPFLETLPIQAVAANTILYVMSKIAMGKDKHTEKYESEVRVGILVAGLVKNIELESNAHASVQQKGENRKRKMGASRRFSPNSRRSRNLKARDDTAITVSGSSQIQSTHPEWPIDAKVKLGTMLISKLIESAQLPVTRKHPRTGENVTQMQPAFMHRVKYHHGKKIGTVMPNPVLMEKLQSEPLGSMLAKRMPMVVEPLPWKNWDQGGYMHYPNPILRLTIGDKSAKEYFLAADARKDLNRVYDGLTALGKVPWNVNRDVFMVQLKAWNSGEEIANFAPLKPEFDMPAEPPSSTDLNARRKWLTELRDIENKKSGLHSKRCFQNFQLEVARAYLNEKFYFPHNLDFRGRAYPIPPYLNHMGADNARGLLTFAEGKPLGSEGLRWLKIHLATIAGYDKASLEERLEYTKSHLDDIYDSARNPLSGRRWWLQAEDAWQLLAACFELTKALDSPDPTKFVSHLPIHQDGTCNGLQHYAALGGDKVGAAQVNLEPGDRPADVYTAVAEAVKEEVRKDCLEGNAIAQKLDGHITRKCVKQPVMTNVYGVTFYGARAQVLKQLEGIFPDVKKFDEVNLTHMSHYITTKIFKCLGNMFGGAQAIQTWLGQCADRISTCVTPEQLEQMKMKKDTMDKNKAAPESSKTKRLAKTVKSKAQAGPAPQILTKANSVIDPANLRTVKPLFRSTVVWTTPLRLPVVQPYRASKTRNVATSIQRISMNDPQLWDPVSKRKQLQAFAPNFIHSLDATHMLLSALKCNELNVTFASIHDSFWTHACDIGVMSLVLRDAFVAMHSEDIVGRLREEFELRHKGCMYLATIVANSPVGLQIAEQRRKLRKEKSPYDNELFLEAERLRLLRSEDPQEREQGEAMVTPGSIVSLQDDESAFALPIEIENLTLGQMPGKSTGRTKRATSAPNESPVATDGPHVANHSPPSVQDTASEQQQSSNPSNPEAAPKALPHKVKYPRKTYVWLPLTFPPVPPKGDFDVTRLRESKYFFH